ncbi:signal transduction histidine kinase [Filimonas zeae]|nr:HAMP domain-containing sensor histidine kinase [Filimonas zeae]MDR6342692.1 signal transduction histidine kinase [Filimonas zeae]
MNKLRISWVFMAGTIVLIAAFQGYWLKKVYKEEYDALQRRTDILLKETVQGVQSERMKNMPLLVRPDRIDRIEIVSDTAKGRTTGLNAKAVITTKARTHTGSINDISDSVLKEKVVVTGIRHAIPDSLRGLLGRSDVKIVMGGRLPDSSERGVFINGYDDIPPPPPFFRMAIANTIDSLKRSVKKTKKGNTKDAQNIQKFIYELRQLDDSIPLRKLDTLYTKALKKEGIVLSHCLYMASLPNRKAGMDSVPQAGGKLSTRFAMAGFNAPFGYYAVFEKPLSYLGRKLLLPVGVSVLLIGVTTLSFVFMYRSLAAQRRLSEMKNGFISNITHELKTPVATVNVAIEALRNFNAIEDAARTKEYLDISAIELQRLNLLIDKVLRLSMFEKQTMELQPEEVDMNALIKEVTTGMRLQLEKANARVELQLPAEKIVVQGDRLHLTSVIYNLLDNAVKYSPGQPFIHVDLQKGDGELIFSVRDNGIGIATTYQKKVFEKFFRVPDNDRHNIRGYGLGLSYVAHIVQLHHGSITVHSEERKGSTFTIKLPFAYEQS